MTIEDKIKRWVMLDNQVKQLISQLQLLKDEKEELTNHLIDILIMLIRNILLLI